MALGKGIPVINGFDLNSKLPLDSRTVADTLEEMNALVTNGSVTDGQLCYCKADKKLYVLKDNVWSEVGGGGGSGSGGSNILRKDGTFVSKEDGNIINTISLSTEEYNKIKNGEINIIYGKYEFEVGGTSLYKVDFNAIIDNMYIYAFSDINDENNETTIFYFQLVITEETATLYTIKTTQPSIPNLPSDASTKNYALNSVNGTLTWNTIGDGLTIENGVLKATSGGGGGGIPVVEVTSVTGDEYTIGKAQTANFVLNATNNYYINMDYIGGAYLGGDVSVIDSGSDTFLQIYTFSGRGTTITKSEKVFALSYLFNDYAIFTEGMQSEEILPYDISADEGKVLTVRNGDLVWETPSASGGSVSVTFED